MGVSLEQIVAPLRTLQGVAVFPGYPPTGTKLPYIAVRPFVTDVDNVALNGQAIDWDQQFSAYCCGASVEASYNLSIEVMKILQGYMVQGSTLSVSLGYASALIEGQYETQVTIQINQGGL